MTMKLEVLPERSDSAAANMAADFLLLRRYPAARAANARVRFYGWHRPSFSFGYSQKIAWVRAQIPEDAEGADLVRRPTGGGVVDHREDWTYALVIPRGHALEKARAVDSYRAVHEALRTALASCGQQAALKVSCEPAADSEGEDGALAGCAAAKGPTVCFTRAELYDVVDVATGVKIAGAAQKRTKEGLLFQGSIWRPAAAGVRDWDDLREAFVAALAKALGVQAENTPWPDFREGEHEALTEQYAAQEWTEAR
jgi:lipoate-protein ligase A